MMIRSLLAAFLLLAGMSPACAVEFEKPVRLKADGQPIDTGADFGHAGPCLVDIDGDGVLDLVVGDFRGKFRYFHNSGTNKAPKYDKHTYLKAGDEDAKVPMK